MHLFRQARVPLACLPSGFVGSHSQTDDRIEPWREVDIEVQGKEIVDVRDTEAAETQRNNPPSSTDLANALVFPGLLDVHTHLDKAHTWFRAPNLLGEFWEALKVLKRDSVHWTEADLHRRAHFALQRAWAHGTVALRTHLDTNGLIGENAHTVMQALRADWAGRIELQTVSLFAFTDFVEGDAARIVELSDRYGATALGGFPQPGPELPRQLDSVLAAARELGIGLDLHIDENGDPQSECLRAVAEAVLRNSFPFPVTCGHCCSLTVQEPARQRSTIHLVKAAGLRIVSLPLCNLYLQDRSRGSADGNGQVGLPKTPRWRGVTLLHELMQSGITVACASDNVRDAFYPWGDLDAVEVYTQSMRIGHLDTRWALSPSVVTTAPAAIMDLPNLGRIAPGARSDFIVFQAKTFSELLSVPGAPRRCVHGETFRSADPPDYAELGSFNPSPLANSSRAPSP